MNAPNAEAPASIEAEGSGDGDHEKGPRPVRRRLPRLVLVAALLGAAYFVFPAVPRDHEVVLRLDDPKSVVAVDVEWSPAHAVSATEPLRGESWQFEAGHAPASIAANIHLPNGDYRLDARVHRATGTDAIERTITLGDASSIAVPLR